MSFNLRTTRIPTLAVSAGIALTALAVTGAPRSAASCNPPKYPGSGYFTGKIRVTNVSCTYGKRFVVAYYSAARATARGPTGAARTRCAASAAPRSASRSPTEIDARVTCRRGTQKIVHTYQQNIE